MPKLVTETIGTGDQSWLGESGPHKPASGVLVKAAFVASTQYPNGYIPSGMPLAKIPSGANAGRYGPAGTRTVADGATTSGSATLTSATAAFTAGDVGASVTGSGVPAGTTISSVTNGTTATMSANATATATGVSVTVLDSLAVFLYTDQPVTADALINAPVIDNGRINVNKLPVSFTPPANPGRFTYNTQN